ncbi:hypothetical protein [uncultured Desulfobacter sp.]|uniref:hypothetical protein n=1 Tax=uncultured Desulfobacter sp. TaxID=240139 RepID=UPI0029F56485|nr:hypothetical protein [uncultured Desulfobacter sp.]
MAGNNEGVFFWPRPGTIVTVRWIEGRPDHPVIQHVYPMGLTLPAVEDDMSKWQQRPGVFQAVDAAGNWTRATDKNINNSASDINETASGAKTSTTGAESTETIATIKSIEAGTAVTIKAPTIIISTPNGSVSLLPTLSTALDAIYDALDVLAQHTHPSVGAIPNQEAKIQSTQQTPT